MENLREALRGPEPLVFTFMMVPRVEIIEMLANAGFDGVVIDLEHGPMTRGRSAGAVGGRRAAPASSRSRACAATAASRRSGTCSTPVWTVCSSRTWRAPSRRRPSCRPGRFPPAGERSLNPYVRGTRYGADGDAARDLANARARSSSWSRARTGSRTSRRSRQPTTSTAIFIGPVDLSASLGVPGQPEHPKVIETVTSIFERLREGKVAAGIFAPTTEAAKRWLAAGAALVALSADSAMMQRAFSATRGELDG